MGFKQQLRRLRRSVLAIGLILYAHALLAGAVALVLWAPTPTAGLIGAAALAALFTLIAVCAGVVMGHRLHQGETPLPHVEDLDRELSGGDTDLADEINEQLGIMREQAGFQASSYEMTAPESR